MNIGEWISKRALLWPDRLFLTQGGLHCTNRCFEERVDGMARALRRLDVQKGERVATLMVNCSAFLEIFFACARTGAVIVPVNTTLAAPELERILRDCSPRVLIYSPQFEALVEQVNKSGGSPAAFQVRHAGGTAPAASALAVAQGLPAAADPPPPAMWEAALAEPLMIMYTSGTTGELKGAVLTHGNFLFGAIHSLISYGMDGSYNSLVVAPLFHIGALAASVTPVVYAGGRLVLREFDNPSEIIHLIAKENINYMFAVPVMFQMMAKAPAWEIADFGQVHFFIAGGAPMPVPLIRMYQEEKGVHFAQGYGMTETLRITALDLENAQRKAGSIGKEVFHTQVRIVDEQDNELPPGNVGEILVKGPTVFCGYWNNPAATAAVLRDGWFHTGDLGRRDGEGYITIVGRKSDMIICAGKNIYAAEVEQSVEALPEVAEAAVVGLPDVKRGEVPAAFVVLKPGAALTAEALAAALKPRLAAYKIPKKVTFIEALPRTGSGKIHKHELKRRFNQ